MALIIGWKTENCFLSHGLDCRLEWSYVPTPNEAYRPVVKWIIRLIHIQFLGIHENKGFHTRRIEWLMSE